VCQLNAYMDKEGSERLLLADVGVVKAEDESILLVTVFGEQQVVNGRIKLVDVIENKLVLEEKPTSHRPNECDEPNKATDDLQKLRVVLPHWIEHNSAHTQEFEKWADKAKKLGRSAVHDEILSAVRKLREANAHLRKALEGLGEGDGTG